MATTTKKLYRGAASTTTTTLLYTTPSSTTTVLTNIAVCNSSSSSRTFTLYVDGVLLHNTASIAANSTAYIDCKQVLPTTATIQGGASATDVIFHISGVEIA